MTFIVIEGVDGSGKDSAADMAAKILGSCGRKAICHRHPDKSNIFGKIESICLLREGNLSKYILSVSYVLDLLVSVIRMKGEDADDVIFVRYHMAALYLDGCIPRMLFRLMHAVFPEPDIGILIDVPTETAIERIESRGHDREVFENIERISSVRERMIDSANDMGWYVVDNSSTRSKLGTALEKILKKRLY